MAITSRVTKQVSSQVTKRNPRPRKYASQAERQAAYRARNVMLEFRAEPKTADNISKIADTLGYPRSDVLLSMVKFALTNHDWARFGLTHKTIPTYKENPTMKPASQAQIAARKRFAEMARSGAFKKATKRKDNPAIPMANSDFAMITEIKLFAENDYDLYRQQGKPIIDNLAKKMAKGQFDPAKAVKLYGYLADSAVKKYSVEQMGKRTPTLTILNKNDRELLAQQLFEAYAEEIADTAKQYAPKRKTNPISGVNAGEFAMTVNGKTMHRWFNHTSDPWAKSHGFNYQLVSNVTKHGAFVKFTKTRAIVAIDEAADGSPVTEKWEIRNLVFYKTNPAKKTVSQKISQLVHEGYPQRQAVAVALSEQRAGKVKRNPRPAKPKKYYQVSIMEQGTHTKFMPMALYFTFAEAENYANYLAKQHKNWTIRVHDTRAM